VSKVRTRGKHRTGICCSIGSIFEITFSADRRTLLIRGVGKQKGNNEDKGAKESLVSPSKRTMTLLNCSKKSLEKLWKRLNRGLSKKLRGRAKHLGTGLEAGKQVRSPRRKVHGERKKHQHSKPRLPRPEQSPASSNKSSKTSKSCRARAPRSLC